MAASPALATQVATEHFDLPGQNLAIFGLQYGADYLAAPTGTIVETRAEIHYTTGSLDAAALLITVQAPSTGVPVWEIRGSDLGWSGLGSFAASLTTDELNGVIDLGNPPPQFSLFHITIQADPLQPLGGQLSSSYVEVDIAPVPPSPTALFNTGVDGGGVSLPVGSAELHYGLSGPASPAVVLAPRVTWAAPPPGSRWIGPKDPPASAGTYAYRLEFDLNGVDPDDLQITGRWAASSSASWNLNGLTPTSCPDEFTTSGPSLLKSFTVGGPNWGGTGSGSTWFTPGANYLEFRVDDPAGGGATGLLVADLAVQIGEQAWFGWCPAGISAGGCQPLLSSTGLASSTATSGFSLNTTGVEGAKDGLYYFGTNGRQANPWGTGTSLQCVVPPVVRLGVLSGTGTAGICDGTFSQDLNALWCSTCPAPVKFPGAGSVLVAQLWYRDPLNTSNQTTSQSNAIELCVGP
jgi:hypothetical protein